MTKNDQKWPKMAQNVPKHVQKPSGIIFQNIDFLTIFDDFDLIFGPFWPSFRSFSLFLASEECPKMTKTGPKWPKMSQDMYKNPQGSFLKTSMFDDFWRFFDLYDPFQSFSGLVAFWGGCKNGKKWPKMLIFPKNCRKTHTYCPDYPPKWAQTPRKSC